MNAVTLTIRACLLAAAAIAAAPASAQNADGQSLFKKNCAACHQASGKGIPGAFPPLVGSAIVLGAPTEATTVLLKGRGGMPDFSASMSDHDIAAVLSYARASWGNKAGPLSGPDVLALREQLQIPKFGDVQMSNKH